MAPAASADPRLVHKPVFILSSIRSGSTLLRVMLNSHSQIYAPHELHLRRIKAVTKSRFAAMAMQELGLDEQDLTNLLWDRILHRELQRSGKRVLINKTPNDVLIWPDIVSCWPEAKLVYLRRHPTAILNSSIAARQDLTPDENARDVFAYASAATVSLGYRREDVPHPLDGFGFVVPRIER